MMKTPRVAAERLKWCEAYYEKDGHPFTTKDREWVITDLFVPMSSWKLWPKNHKRLCDKCREQIGRFVDWSPQLIARLSHHRDDKSKCLGLLAYPVMVTILNVQRGAGKTMNGSALELAIMGTSDHLLRLAFVAAAGDQARTLFLENSLEPILASKKLQRNFYTKGDRLYCKPTGCVLELRDTSHRSITGPRRDIYRIDEARDVEGRTFTALLPTIRARARFECPAGHAKMAYDLESAPKCNACKKVMWPVVPRLLITSTSGMIDGGTRDWFNELCDAREEKPLSWVHIYRDDKAANPDAAQAEHDMMTEVFGDVPSLADGLDVELHNVARRKGEDFLSVSQIKTMEEASLAWLEGSLAPGFAFLDTSLSKDLTSWVVVLDDDDLGEELWRHIRLARADVWDPQKERRGIIKPEKIFAHLDYYMPLFPNVQVDVDVRGGMAWAIELVRQCREDRPAWGRRVHSFHGKHVERRDAWTVFEQRALSGTYRQPPHEIIREELKGVRRHYRLDGGYEIRDRNRKRQHAELIEGIAECCRKIYLEQTRPKIKVKDVMGADAGLDAALSKMWSPLTKGLKGGSF